MTEPLLCTARLLLRPLCSEDAEALFAYRSDPRVAATQGWSAASRAEAVAFVARFGALPFPQRGDWSQLAVVEAASRALVGDVGVNVHGTGDVAEVGYTIAPAYQRRGYATEAMKAVLAHLTDAHGVRQFIAHTLPHNVRSIALLQRLGFVEERSEADEVEFRRPASYVGEVSQRNDATS